MKERLLNRPKSAGPNRMAKERSFSAISKCNSGVNSSIFVIKINNNTSKQIHDSVLEHNVDEVLILAL